MAVLPACSNGYLTIQGTASLNDIHQAQDLDITHHPVTVYTIKYVHTDIQMSNNLLICLNLLKCLNMKNMKQIYIENITDFINNLQ